MYTKVLYIIPFADDYFEDTGLQTRRVSYNIPYDESRNSRESVLLPNKASHALRWQSHWLLRWQSLYVNHVVVFLEGATLLVAIVNVLTSWSDWKVGVLRKPEHLCR
jgi:hypothetical protein